MIDTDKYEDWTDDFHVWEQYVKDIDYEPDRLLIADAPLLLAEVKQLQDALKEAVEVVKEMESMAYADADADKFANHALEFIGNVKELIE